MGDEIHFSDHAAWRTAERHGESVSLDLLAMEIQAALDGGWGHATSYGGADILVTIRSGDRFVLRPVDNGFTVLTALPRRPHG